MTKIQTCKNTKRKPQQQKINVCQLYNTEVGRLHSSYLNAAGLCC